MSPKTTEGHIWTPQDGHSIGLATNSVIPSTSNIKSSYDVIVIGAGFAGLIAARDLSLDPNTSVLLLEGRDRIGGRTWTAQAWGEQFEMGGTWIHWCQPHVYAEASRYRMHKTLKTTAGGNAEDLYWKPRGEEAVVQSPDPVKDGIELERLATEFFTLDGLTARDLMPFPHEPLRSPSQPWTKYDNLSVRDRLDQMDEPADSKDQLESMFDTMGSGTGKETAFTTALSWYALVGYSMANFLSAAGTYKFGKGGMTAFAKRILDDYSGDLLFGAKVQRLEQDATGAKVVCQDGKEIRAKQIVCTVPLNVLKEVQFEPSLSSLRQEAIARGHMNRGAKIHYSLEGVQRGWFANTADPEKSDLLFALSDNNGSQQDRTYCIGFGWNSRLEDTSDNKAFVSALQKLKTDASVKGYLTHDWAKDEFSNGTWYCSSPGMTTKYLEELQTPHGRVTMASADWADGWRGFVDGAIEQGARAAMQVMSALASEKAG